MKSILIIEDDRNIADLIRLHISELPANVEVKADGTDGLNAALENNYDLIVLDIMLPRLDGIEVCRHLRGEKVTTPILMLTAKAEEIDKVLGLEIGADDYMTKPFSVRELIARVKALLRRSELTAKPKATEAEEKIIQLEHMEIHGGKKKVTKNGKRLDLTPKEFELLMLLASNPGKTFTRERLLNLVWGYDFEGFEHTVNSHINRLRGKIEDNINAPKYILTTWGMGYRFNDEL